MVSKEDLNYWHEAIGDLKELKERDKYSAKEDKTLNSFLSKVKKANRGTKITKTPINSPKIVNPHFKLKKGTSLGLDKQTDKKLRSGKYPINIKIDLHGENLEDAYFKLKDTIDYAYEEGYRLILAITGKGLHSAEDKETIKSSLQKWLSYQEISSKIIKYIDAHKKHGGSGAVYILLRKNR